MERVERSSSVAAEHDSDLGNEEDLEEMDSQLNPDAKEFVPVSPQRTSIGSPFGNGIHNRFDLMDDEVVSQSPRKGSAIVMDENIVLPAENDFTEISQRPSELVANELNFDNLLVGNGAGGDDVKELQRPESSNSQCSYQVKYFGKNQILFMRRTNKPKTILELDVYYSRRNNTKPLLSILF